jgi:4-alpha-glucanotransferase
MNDYEKLIYELSELAGILPEYYDIFGKKHVISKESRVAILSAMGLLVGTAQEVALEIEKKKARKWHAVLDPVTVISVNSQPYLLAVHLALPVGKEQTAETTLSLEDEQGKRETLHFPAGTLEVNEQRIIEDRRFARFLLPLPQKEIGYYRVTVICSHPEPVFDNNTHSLERSARLIVGPDSCYMPEHLQTGKTWGVAANLYALRSARNWGCGDFGDLRKLVTWLSGLNAGLVGINPLHAIPNTVPSGISPYSPISRLYRNFIYIDMEDVAEMSLIPVSAHAAQKIDSLRKSDRIDYQGVAAVKQELLEQAFEIFYRDHYLNNSVRGKAFREYIRTEGAPLEKFALFLALSEHMRNEHKASAWPEWPEEYRSPDSASAEAFRKNNEKRMLFFAYIQWLINSQMAEVSEATSSGGMLAGLYGDLAIGAVDSGSDGWMYQDVLAELVTVGAPPDDFNANGQNWGFPPMIPDKLRESGYDMFIQTIRKNMQHMGALRIDHALGLFRLFWIPKGIHPCDGAYVGCKAEELIRIIALESVRNRTLVIGEDLGTITDEARQTLQRFGILSYRLFYFERNYPDPSFIPPERYPAMALSAINTHDLPTLYGYWSGRDLDVKKQLGIISDEPAYAQQKSDRERDRKLLLKALEMRGILRSCTPGDPSSIPAMTPELCSAVYQYLSVSPAKLVLVSLDDVIGTIDQQNLPGTVSEYPNWMQKTPLSLEEIIADPLWQDLADMFRNTRAVSNE